MSTDGSLRRLQAVAQGVLLRHVRGARQTDARPGFLGPVQIRYCSAQSCDSNNHIGVSLRPTPTISKQSKVRDQLVAHIYHGSPYAVGGNTMKKEDLKNVLLDLIDYVKKANKNDSVMLQILEEVKKGCNEREELEEEMIQLKSNNEVLLKELADVKSHLSALHLHQQPTMENDSSPPPSFADAVKKSVHPALKEDKAKCDVIISKVEEKGKDKSFAADLCSKISFDTKPIGVMRLGRKKEDTHHHRLLKLSFSTNFEACAFCSRFEEVRKYKPNDLSGFRVRPGRKQEDQAAFRKRAIVANILNKEAKREGDMCSYSKLDVPTKKYYNFDFFLFPSLRTLFPIYPILPMFCPPPNYLCTQCTNNPLTTLPFYELDTHSFSLVIQDLNDAQPRIPMNIDSLNAMTFDVFNVDDKSAIDELDDIDPDLCFYNQISSNRCSDYYSENSLQRLCKPHPSSLSIFHCNIRSFFANSNELMNMMTTINYEFPIICLSETWLGATNCHLANIPSYNHEYSIRNARIGGAGDYNINLLTTKSHLSYSDFVDVLFANSFLPTINKPTRITGSSATIIDNIFINNLTRASITSGILANSISDHCPVFCFTLFHNNKSNQNNFIIKRLFTDRNKNKFHDLISSTQWDQVLNEANCRTAFTSFYTQFTTIFDQSFPLTKIKLGYKNRKPWLTDAMKNSIKMKNKLYCKYLKTKNPNDQKQYKSYKITLRSILYKAERTHYDQLFCRNKNNLRKSWEVIKTVIHKQKFNNKQQYNMEVNGKKTSDLDIITKHFNEYFINVGPNLSKSIPYSNIDPISYITQTNRYSYVHQTHKRNRNR
ncbi:hypothetical protein CAPTEDRAFT_192879 [Capitella teleta]|uniref:Endonuclease/exonuclease/phosphatase domain-containing protein n=1 Tax=Capitella teleta TaxID=283909 RepID=R7UFH0_CAPTE|nr:hypothetical protein CAPTEDRAFT_192879 [Capitella teleta]|eukprot:ELU02007.1 hypothetical protein CAPTEDRAFT_192879 [Capitella teleta]